MSEPKLPSYAKVGTRPVKNNGWHLKNKVL